VKKSPESEDLRLKSPITIDHIEICVSKHIQTSETYQWPCASPRLAPSLYSDNSVPTGPEFRYLDIVRYTILRLETSGSSFMQEATGLSRLGPSRSNHRSRLPGDWKLYNASPTRSEQ